MKKSTRKYLLWGGLAYVAYKLLKPKPVAVAAPQQTSNYLPTGLAGGGGHHHHHHGGGGGGGFWAGPSGIWSGGPWWDYPSTEVVYLAPTTCVDAKTKKPVPCP